MSWRTGDVSDSIMSAIHGQFFSVVEIEIPQWSITFNDYGNRFNVFETGDRHDKAEKIKEIELPNDFAEKIVSHFKDLEYLKKKTRELLNEVKINER